MTKAVKKMGLLIREEVRRAKKILLHLHPGPDGDSLGANLAFLEALENLGKEVVLARGNKPVVDGSFLPGFGKIIPKDYSELDLSEFDLFIILDISSQDFISGTGPIIFPKGLRIVLLDHHKSNGGFGDVVLVDDSYAATCQVVYDLFKLWKVNVTAEMASCLMLGIYTDTGGFKYDYTSSDTFSAAAELAKINPHYHKDIFCYENSRRPGEIRYLGLSLGNIEVFFRGKVALSAIPYEKLKDLKLARDDVGTGETANFLKSVDGWDIGVSAVEKTPGTLSIGFRTRDIKKYDLSQIARALGGGGHRGAAGAGIVLPFAKAKSVLLKKLALVYPELGAP